MNWWKPLFGALIACCAIGAAAFSLAREPGTRARVSAAERFSFAVPPADPQNLPVLGDAMHGPLLPADAFEPAPLASSSWTGAENEKLLVGPLSIETAPDFNRRGRQTLYRLRDVTLFGGDVIGRVDGKGGTVMLRWKDGD